MESWHIVQKKHPVGDIVQALLGIFFQTASEQAPDLDWNARPIRLFLQYRGENIGNSLTIEQLLAGEHFVQHHAEPQYRRAC